MASEAISNSLSARNAGKFNIYTLSAVILAVGSFICQLANPNTVLGQDNFAYKLLLGIASFILIIYLAAKRKKSEAIVNEKSQENIDQENLGKLMQILRVRDQKRFGKIAIWFILPYFLWSAAIAVINNINVNLSHASTVAVPAIICQKNIVYHTSRDYYDYYTDICTGKQKTLVESTDLFNATKIDDQVNLNIRHGYLGWDFAPSLTILRNNQPVNLPYTAPSLSLLIVQYRWALLTLCLVGGFLLFTSSRKPSKTFNKELLNALTDLDKKTGDKVRFSKDTLARKVIIFLLKR